MVRQLFLDDVVYYFLVLSTWFSGLLNINHLFKAFTLSMLFLSANTYITRFYYAKGNSIIPILFSLINVFGVNLCIIYLLIDTYEAVAIAYGTAISAATNFIMLQAYAKWKWKLSIFEKIM